MQRARKRNLDMIQRWIMGSGGVEKVNRPALMRKAMLIIGCTRATAEEYVRIVLGEEKV